MTRRTPLAIAFLLCATPFAYGQPAGDTNATTRTQIIVDMVAKGRQAIEDGVRTNPFQTTFGNGRNDAIAKYLIAAHADRAQYQTLLDAMQARVDKQVGSTASGSGSTSLTTKGLVPEILGAAVESGALTEDVKGTVVTFRATPAGVVKALQGQGILETYRAYSNDTGLRYASRFSAAASFDASNGQSDATFTGSARQLTNWSVRYVVFNGRDPASEQYSRLWKPLVQDTAYQDAVEAVNTALTQWPAFQDWQKALTGKVATEVDGQWTKDGNAAAAAARFKAILDSAMPALEKLPAAPPAMLDALDRYVAASLRVSTNFDSIYDFVNKGVLVTFDFSTARDTTLPDLYTATGVIEAGLGASRKTDLTVNLDATVYKHTPANASQAFKSFNVSAQLEHPLGASFVIPSATAALSARYSYLPKDTVAASAGTSGTAASGSIFYVQGKVTVPIKGSGMKVPLSVTASNRTELIKEANVRGSVGLTFDLDTFMTALGVKK